MDAIRAWAQIIKAELGLREAWVEGHSLADRGRCIDHRRTERIGAGQYYGCIG